MEDRHPKNYPPLISYSDLCYKNKVQKFYLCIGVTEYPNFSMTFWYPPAAIVLLG